MIQEDPPDPSSANQILLSEIKRKQDSPCLEHAKLGAPTMLTSKGKKVGLETHSNEQACREKQKVDGE